MICKDASTIGPEITIAGDFDCPPTIMCEDVKKCDFEQPTNIPQNCCE